MADYPRDWQGKSGNHKFSIFSLIPLRLRPLRRRANRELRISRPLLDMGKRREKARRGGRHAFGSAPKFLGQRMRHPPGIHLHWAIFPVETECRALNPYPIEFRRPFRHYRPALMARWVLARSGDWGCSARSVD